MEIVVKKNKGKIMKDNKCTFCKTLTDKQNCQKCRAENPHLYANPFPIQGHSFGWYAQQNRHAKD